MSISDTSSSTLHSSRLDIMSVTKEDIGSYECRATNFPALYFSAFIMIIVLCKFLGNLLIWGKKINCG